ncbi:hypothetical protein [Streptomyces sp. NPDC048410]|uniref:hypothetical protein n=1 Tax=Streptomyces sp. NPDC048410 TaxID=3365545 RepID=UPI003714FD3E
MSGRPVLRHIGAMHLSGFVLLCSFVVMPSWLTEAAYATPPDDPTADAPFMVLLVVPLLVLGLHIAVQIPAGLMGAWLGRGTWARYRVSVAVAAALTMLLFRGDTGMWLDALARTALGLGAYAWVLTGAVGRLWRGY